MKRYNVHELVSVCVDGSMSASLIDALEFQIGYFKCKEGEERVTPYEIRVFSYKRNVRAIKEKAVSEFHLSHGVKGEIVHEPKKQLAVEKNPNGFTIYSDSPNFLINLYIQLILVSEGYTLIHSAGYCDGGDNATLLAGAGGVGKTALLGHIVKRFGYRHMGDDIVIVGKDDVCLSFPRAFVFKEYHRAVYPEVFRELKIPRWSTYGIKRFAIENAPFLGVTKRLLRRSGLYYAVAGSLNLAPYLAAVPVERIFGKGSVASKGKIDQIIFLERCSGNEFVLDEMSSLAMSRRLFSIIHHEWSAVLEHLFVLGAMELVDLPEYFGRVSKIIEKVIDKKTLLMLNIPHTAGPEELASQYEIHQLV
jgi:hypothetical protein